MIAIEMKTKDANEPLLTLAKVVAKQQEVVADERALRTIADRLNANRAMLEMMLNFVPEGARESILSGKSGSILPDVKGQPRKRTRMAKVTPPVLRKVRIPRVESFRAAISAVLKKAPSGLTHKDVMDRLLATPYADRVTRESGKAYYNTAGKMITLKLVIKHADKLYNPKTFESIKAAGKLPPVDPGAQVRTGSATQLALEVLMKHPEGLTGPQLKQQMVLLPNAPQSVASHGQYIYNVLSTLVGSGRVVKDGSVYLVSEGTKPPRRNGVAS